MTTPRQARDGRHVTVDAFFDGGRDMRRAIDRRLSDRSSPFDPGRFVWEAWHVDGQFSQLRTPARAFFPAALIAAFEARLLRWAGAAYGVSRFGGPPWLSVITDGGFQSLHRDGPNGQIAFTFALGRRGAFRGGETLIARDELLDYFRTGSHRPAVAHTPLFDEISPRPNRLIAFDSRIPHAVRTVEGPRHARDGRIALQGWLEAAGCVVEGRLAHGEVDDAVGANVKRLAPRALRGAEGLVAVRVEVQTNGCARTAEIRASTLVPTGPDARAPERAALAIAAAVAKTRFPKGPARITVPVLVGGSRARVPSA